MAKKMGRPVKDGKPKDKDINFRVTTEFYNKLNEYCKENGVAKSEVLVKGAEIYMQENKKSSL